MKTTFWAGLLVLAAAAGCGGHSARGSAQNSGGQPTSATGGTSNDVGAAGRDTREPPVRCPATCPSTCQDDRCVEVLAASLRSPTALALTRTAAYFSTSIGIMTVGKTGGPPSVLVSTMGEGRAAALAVDETYAYWSGSYDSKLMRAALATGAPEVLAEGSVSAIALDSTAIYWSNWQDGTIWTIPKSGGAPTVLTAARHPSGLAIDANRIYWSEDVEADGAVVAMPLGGGPPITLAAAQGAPRGVALDTTHVFWTATFDETICRVPLAGGPFEVLSKGTAYPERLVVDGASVYWIGDYCVQKVRSSGGTAQRLPGDEFPNDLAVDETSVYFLNDGEGGPEGNGTLIKLTPK